MNLIIVESPTKAKTLSRFLGKDYQIEASMGHIRDLPQSKLGIDIENDFTPDYVIPAKKKDKVKELQKAASKAKTVILATDPDREGEAISWHIASLLDKKANLKRITFHEITESAINEALEHPGEIDMKLVDAQQARRILDRLVGYKLSPLLWRKVRRGLSAGRVQSVAVRLIVEREREIQKFVPVEYWDIVAELDKKGTIFSAKLLKSKGGEVTISSQADADKVLKALEAANYTISNVASKEVKRNPYAPFTTSTLQQAGANMFGWSAKRTMQVAQNLYEQGVITYHRTDSTNLSAEALTTARDYIKSDFGPEYLPAEARVFKTKSKVAQEAHEAIRPTQVTTKELSGDFDRDQHRLYELIWKRFLASQMNEARYLQTSIDITAGDYIFRASGNNQLFDGWQKLFKKVDKKEKEEGDEAEDKEEEQSLPELTVGETVDLKKLEPSQHFTQPPPRFNEASLIKVLEEYGIGRPSTYAPIISTIQERQYVEKLDKRLNPTVLGIAVNDFLVTNFPNIFEYQFTAKLEDELDEIANGEKKWVPIIREFYDPFASHLETVTETAQRVKVEVEETDEMCPTCGAPLVVRVGKFGKFLACSKFPDCKFTKPFARKIDVKCPKCEIGDIVMKRTKSKKSFYGCSRYPDCDYASWTKPKIPEENIPVHSPKDSNTSMEI